jgi:hypothetical protein
MKGVERRTKWLEPGPDATGAGIHERKKQGRKKKVKYVPQPSCHPLRDQSVAVIWGGLKPPVPPGQERMCEETTRKESVPVLPPLACAHSCIR